jgi:hypothetical protein
MAVPDNIRSLAEKSKQLLEELNFDPFNDNPFELCNQSTYAKTGLFPLEIIPKMFGKDIGHDIHDGRETTVAKNIGMILIRPDMVHVAPQFETFISERYEILGTDDPVIDSSIYWQLYKHDVYRADTVHSRLNRAALYIGSRSRLVVFKGREHDAGSVPLADFVRNVLKGQQGVQEFDTLRGDIVYRNALALDLHDLSKPNIDPLIPLATDPFTLYRKIVKQPLHESNQLEHPLLFFTGVGVHVPNYSEIANDLPLFVDDTSLYSEGRS